MTTRETIIAAARRRFASHGFLGTPIQQIAEDIGMSKASVLYHFASKESLLEAVLEPTIIELERFFGGRPILELTEDDPISRRVQIERFVDTLMFNREAVTIFLTQRGALTDVPIIERGNEMLARITNQFATSESDAIDRLRLAVALAGTAFVLGDASIQDEGLDEAEKRRCFVEILADLSAPRSGHRVPRVAAIGEQG